MIDPKAPDDQKLRSARELAEEATEHYEFCNDERALCCRFYHNTGGTGQWRELDLQYLKRLGRQPITHNILKGKINNAVGMHMEQQRRPVLRPVGGEDKFAAEVLNAVCERVWEEGGFEQCIEMDLHNGYVQGEGDCALIVEPDSMNPAHLRIEAYSADPQEIGWDPGSTLEDRSDAGYVLWERWLTKAEFYQEYPDDRDAWETLTSEQDRWADVVASAAEGGESAIWKADDYGKKRDYYYDRKKRRARIVHLEYKALRTRTYVIQSGQSIPIPAEKAKIAREDKYGYWRDRGWRLQDVKQEEVYCLEFCGVKILYDSAKKTGDASYHPFDGFGVDPFVYEMDKHARIPYGPCRDLIPPQEELNKGISSANDHVVGQHKTGWLAEEDAIQDPRFFEREVARTGSVALVRKNALVENRVHKREVPQFSPAAVQRIELSLSLMDRISGISADLERPAALNEPATSVMIRYHKSQLGLATPRARFDRHIEGLYRRIAQTVSRAMPDTQIQELLSNTKKYRVQNGYVINLQSNPQQPQVLALRDLRSMRYDVELDVSTRNQTLRSLKLRQWLELHQAGVPIPLHMIAEAATDSRAEREQLKEYAEQQAEQAAQMAQMQSQQTAAAVEKTLQIEAGKVAESSRHNQAQEQLDAMKQAGSWVADMAAIWEKADANEKRAVTDMFRTLQQRQTAREQTMTRPIATQRTLQ